ncbi:MAG: ribosome small subunit-dependent GTPase A [bacterium]
MTLEALGFNAWFKDQTDAAKLNAYTLARVITVNKDNYIIKSEEKEVKAEITGRLMFSADSGLDFPTVGDWVYAKYFDDDSFAVIHEIFPRRTVLRRKTPGRKIDYQLIATNIDTAFIMQSLDSNFNVRRLERYLVMIHEGGIHPVIFLSKSDLLSRRTLEEKLAEIRSSMPNVRVMTFSNLDPQDIEKVRECFKPGETYCLLGSSGVGKTTLLNNLLGEEVFKTLPLRVIEGKGRHTTTRRQLSFLSNGAMIIDTPGMRELGNIGAESGLDATFDEIARLTDECRFTDCTHTVEDGCVVLAALASGILSADRYNSYIKMKKEFAFHERSYFEKRQREKAFGKLCKSVMKHHVKK